MANFRSEKLLATVRQLPCALCFKPGQSQASHSNQQRDGKGMAIKAHDYRIAALCHSCHSEIDQGSQHTKQHRRELWDEAHRRTIGWLFDEGKLEVKQ